MIHRKLAAHEGVASAASVRVTTPPLVKEPRAGNKVASQALPLGDFLERAPALLKEIQNALFEDAASRLRANIQTDIGTLDELEAYFGPGEEDEDTEEIRGWVRASWSRPAGLTLDGVVDRLKALKLTIRNAPMEQLSTSGKCLFTGGPGVEDIIIARAY
jgi:prolyl-tRNA synthetase